MAPDCGNGLSVASAGQEEDDREAEVRLVAACSSPRAPARKRRRGAADADADASCTGVAHAVAAPDGAVPGALHPEAAAGVPEPAAVVVLEVVPAGKVAVALPAAPAAVAAVPAAAAAAPPVAMPLATPVPVPVSLVASPAAGAPAAARERGRKAAGSAAAAPPPARLPAAPAAPPAAPVTPAVVEEAAVVVVPRAPGRGLASRSRERPTLRGRGTAVRVAPALPAPSPGAAASSSGVRRRDSGCIAAEPLDSNKLEDGDELQAKEIEEKKPKKDKEKEKKPKKDKDKDRDKEKGEKRRKNSERSGSEGKKKRKKHSKERGEAKEVKDPKEAPNAKDGKEVKDIKGVKEPRDQAAGPPAVAALGLPGAAATAIAASASRPRKSKWEAERAKAVSKLGDIGDLQRRLEDERNKLRLWVIKAKQEWEERHERRGQAPGATNEEEYYCAAPGEVFGPHGEYQAIESIGKGVFSSVFRCKTAREKGPEFAIKFVRSNNMMRKAAEKEVETYRKLAKYVAKEDLDAAPYIILLAGKETFVHQGHLCMVFELQKCDLRSALQKYGQGRGLPMQTVAQYSKQIFMALRALRKLRIIHGDLKPDNLLMSMPKTEIKICDFGSAMDVSETINTAYLQPRYYRAPEVIIGNQYDTQIDLWSAGVTLFELGTGKILLTGKTNNVMLHQMLELCGPIPKRMATKGSFSSKHFSSDGDFLLRDPDSITGLPELMPMKKFAKPARSVQSFMDRVLKEPPPNADTKTQERLLPRLGDLVSKCLRLDPTERFTPQNALDHQFHKKDKS